MKNFPLEDDGFIPMEANDFEALREQKRKRNEHWQRMRRAQTLWRDDLLAAGVEVSDMFDFWKWLEVNYGLVPERDPYGNITEGYAITNEKLYTLFLLKFS